MDPKAAQRAILRAALEHAATHFGAAAIHEPVLGWKDRSIGARVRLSAPAERWLRVVWANPQWANGPWWLGNESATHLTGIPKPRMLASQEWDNQGLRLRAELMTLVPGTPCSPTPELRTTPDLPEHWWESLRGSLDRLRDHSTDRRATDQQTVTRRLRVFFGDRIDPEVTHWTTAHGDLHWNNLHGPTFSLLDWEGWGLAPAGYDAAGLYCQSLLEPAVARRVHEVFADILDTPDGIRAQLFAITRLLSRADAGEFTDLVIPLHQHADRLLGR
ncbi:aminoglycoside phosphotransferase [Streptomyces sp. NPDC093707]|uniref:aminoglycoside phosphotransferase n=1 Tax=Streptomyces sp. NPDC093707 TaxID=3154984 RepID=UPI00344D1393